MKQTLKLVPDAENEIHDLNGFNDMGRVQITPLMTLPDSVAEGVVKGLAGLVDDGHADRAMHIPDGDLLTRAQMFEEGAVLLTSPPFEGFEADRYVMDFYDVADRDICSRMHMHTGMRFVRMMTGPATSIRVSTLTAPLVVSGISHTAPRLETFEDVLQEPDAPDRTRFNVIVPPCCWVDMQIPRGTAHQFNAIGPYAVIDTVHPEESLEILREHASRINMMAQTVFLQKAHPPAEDCIPPRTSGA